jgi:hypothetical protein
MELVVKKDGSVKKKISGRHKKKESQLRLSSKLL